jgi:hypothetical protein
MTNLRTVYTFTLLPEVTHSRLFFTIPYLFLITVSTFPICFLSLISTSSGFALGGLAKHRENGGRPAHNGMGHSHFQTWDSALDLGAFGYSYLCIL